MRRFRDVKHQRMERLGREMASAAFEVREARRMAKTARIRRKYEPERSGQTPDPEIEAEAARKLAAEEEAIGPKYDLRSGWNYDEHQTEYEKLWRKRRGPPIST
jgi:hypothetical protein